MAEAKDSKRLLQDGGREGQASVFELGACAGCGRGRGLSKLLLPSLSALFKTIDSPVLLVCGRAFALDQWAAPGGSPVHGGAEADSELGSIA